MGANAGKKRVTMRHPHEDIENPLECFEFQVEHYKERGWELVEDDEDPAEESPATADEKAPAAKPAGAKTAPPAPKATDTPKEG
ncbi:MAG: hypothetical protein AAGA99_27320 [Actinomycetota bacterium]